MSSYALSSEQCQRFDEDGFLTIPGLLSGEEIDPLVERLGAEPDLFCKVGALDWVFWTDPKDDLVGTLPRLTRFVDAAETLIGEPCYHWHSKLVRKPPGRDEELDWHQDFGAWYKDGCLMPALVTVVVALTPATSANGCLRLMRGSHQMGRLDRTKGGYKDYSYFSINPKRLEAVKQRFDVHEMEMAPGDAFFFHANTFHASGPNLSDGPRTLLQITYNAQSNAPMFEGQEMHAPRPLNKAPDTSIVNRDYDTVVDHTRLIDLDDPDDPGRQIFYGRRFNPELC